MPALESTTAVPTPPWESLAAKVPVQSLYNLLVIYLFLPLPRKDVAVAFGMTASAICVALFLGIEIDAVS
jgi:hypothetical protein